MAAERRAQKQKVRSCDVNSSDGVFRWSGAQDESESKWFLGSNLSLPHLQLP